MFKIFSIFTYSGNKYLEYPPIFGIQELKKLKLSSEKCKALKNNSSSNGDKLSVEDKALDIENSTSYPGDVFSDKGHNTALCKDRTDKAVASTIELFSSCKEVKVGRFKISNLLTLYRSVFIPRLIYNCEAWSNLKVVLLQDPKMYSDTIFFP